MKFYKINENTLAVVPFCKSKTVVYEKHNYFILDTCVSNVINDNCEYYGSSLEGRLKGTYSMLGFNYKAPIVMSEKNDTIFFPTCSPRLKECSWINANNVCNIYPTSNDKTIILFKNNEKIHLDTSFNIIKNQYYKSLSLNNAVLMRKHNSSVENVKKS